MTVDKLFDRLKAAYTAQNLNRITTRVIEAYRCKNFTYIKSLHKKVYSAVHVEDGRINKIFADLILRYHPDRLNYYISAIDGTEDIKRLDQYTHIFEALDNLDMNVRDDVQTETDYIFIPEEEYVIEESDFDYIIEEDENFEHDFTEELAYSNTHDFITMLTLNEYGHNRFEIPHRDLENLIGMLDMSNQGIEDLNGIEYCVNLTGLDLSDNELVDITDLGSLVLLEELYLGGNSILAVDGLMLLDKLEKIDLSFNSLDDINPLIGLPKLKFVNLIGNPVPAEQIAKLREQGVVVVA